MEKKKGKGNQQLIYNGGGGGGLVGQQRWFHGLMTHVILSTGFECPYTKQ